MFCIGKYIGISVLLQEIGLCNTGTIHRKLLLTFSCQLTDTGRGGVSLKIECEFDLWYSQYDHRVAGCVKQPDM